MLAFDAAHELRAGRGFVVNASGLRGWLKGIVVLLLASSVLRVSAADLLIDTDMLTDCDDVAALELAYACERKGDAKVLAVTVSSSYPKSVPVVEAVNAFCGRADLPVGAPKNGTGYRRDDSCFLDKVAAEFPHRHASNDEAPDAVEVMRRTLAAAPDGSVTLVTLGYLSNVASLLKSGADAISPLDGRELLSRKVKEWACMGGNFPNDPAKDNVNFTRDASAAVFALTNYPGRITFVGREIGHSIFIGDRFHGLPAANPLRRAYELHRGRFGKNWDHHTADPTTILYAVYGVGERFGRVEGTLHLKSNCAFSWDPSRPSNMSYLTQREARKETALAMERLLLSGMSSGESGVIELVDNVAMERLDEKGKPLGWSDGEGMALKEADGNHFIRIVQKTPGKMTSIYRKAEIPEGCDRLAVSLRGRVTGLITGEHHWYDARVLCNFKDASGKVVKSDFIEYAKDTGGWERREKVIGLPEGAATLEWMITLFNCQAGAFDVDDVRVTLLKAGAELPREALGAPKTTLLPKVVRPALTAADELRVEGNRIVNAAGQKVWLQGVAVPSLGWMAAGEHVTESVAVAVEEWGANVIRLALHSKFWFATANEPWNKRTDGGAEYRRFVDSIVDYCNAHGCYVVLDLHEYRAATKNHAKFWTDCAARYANRPGVLFDILNEPYDISWREWRDGGVLKDGGGDAPAETEDGRDLRESIGMQKLVETVRATGAKNVIIAGGLDWSYDCTGIGDGYALVDPSGRGIVYSVHVYPWKSDWQKKFLDCAAKHPLFLGEVGCMLERQPYEKTLVDPYKWAPDILACIQKHQLSWTAWSFHPQAAPCVIADWNYTPTPFWGSYVRAALNGARFVSDRLR